MNTAEMLAEIDAKMADLDSQAENIQAGMDMVKQLSEDFRLKPANMGEVMDVQTANFQCMSILVSLTKTVYKLKKDLLHLSTELRVLRSQVPNS